MRLLKVSIKGSADAAIDTAFSFVPGAGVAKAITKDLASPILKELVDVVFEQTSSIDRKLDKLIEVDYKVGIEYLRDAGNVSDQMRVSHIQDALREFTRASKLENEVVRQAQSMFYVGVCYTLLGQHNAALRWYRDAYQKGKEHLDVLRQRVDAETAGYGKASSFKAIASEMDKGVSSVPSSVAKNPLTRNMIMVAARNSMRIGDPVAGAAVALLVLGAGYATLGAIKGGKAIAGAIETNKAKHLSKSEQELVTFYEHFLKPLEQLVEPH
jgi:tetratricopeptide (TPR) repeat protein